MTSERWQQIGSVLIASKTFKELLVGFFCELRRTGEINKLSTNTGIPVAELEEWSGVADLLKK